ncbi:MAG: HAMP domain-containing histidine kinase [Spirochaetales bacterium]|nr:HAMP domain-containing histidine kinase [Spirochaetales bacterium]
MKHLVRKLYFRLTVLFSFIFLSAFVLYSLFTFSFLYQSFEQEDDLFFQRKLLSYWASYQNQGEGALFADLYRENIISGDRPFLIRAANSRNQTLFLHYPDPWRVYNLNSLEEYEIQDFARKLIVRAPGTNEDLEIFSTLFNENLLIQVGISTGRRTAVIRNYRKNVVMFLSVLGVLCIVISTVLASRALQPIKYVNRTARDIIRTGNLKGRVPLRGSGDDLDELGGLFNAMLERIEVLIDRMKDTVNAVAHDLKTPLTRLRGTAELALRPGTTELERQEALSDVIEASEEILVMLNSIMDINEAEAGTMRLRMESLDLCGITEEVADMYRFIADEKHISLDVIHPENILSIQGDSGRIRQATGNLLDNAIKYSPEHSSVRLYVENTCQGPVIAVEDEGPGIGEDERELVFGRLYRGSSAKGTKGTGLGLSLVKAIMEAHGGTVEVHPGTGGGTRVVLQFRHSGDGTCNSTNITNL